jgi:hypothetical protein
MLPPLKPIAMKERISMIFIDRGEIDSPAWPSR